MRQKYTIYSVHFLVLLTCILCINLLTNTLANTYDFANHPVAEEDNYTGFIADLDTSNSLAAKFEDTLSESLTEGANFAGKYRLTTIDCGAQCQVNVIIDISSGKVVDSTASSLGVEFAVDSRLIKLNPDSDFEYFLVWNEDKQRFLRAYIQEVVLDDGRSCFWLGTDTNGTTIHLDGSNNIYGCDALPNVTPGTQASILRGTLYHDGGKPIGKFNADYMELKIQDLSAEIAQEKQVNIDIKQIRTQTGSCLKLDPIELEPTIKIYYLCDEGDDTHIVVLSSGFTQIGNALITEMIRLQRDGENLIVAERLPVYVGLSAAGVDGVSESEKVSEVKPADAETEVATEESIEAIESTEAEVIGPETTDVDSASDLTEDNESTSTETNEVTQEASESNEDNELTNEAAESNDSQTDTDSVAAETPEDGTEETAENTVEEMDATVDDATEDSNQATVNIPDEATNPQTIGTVAEAALTPALMAASATQEAIDSVTETEIVNPTAIAVVRSEPEETNNEATANSEETTNVTETAEESNETSSDTVAENDTESESETQTEQVTETQTAEAQTDETQTDAIEVDSQTSQETQTSTVQEVEEVSEESSEDSAEAGDEEASEPEISVDNWQSHPDVVSTRMMYTELNEFIDIGLLRHKTQSFERCNDYQESERKLWADKGITRRYITSYGGEQGASEVEHTYDDKGMLRYVYISEGVSAGANEDDAETVLEHQIYYTEEGSLLWHEKQFLKQDSGDLGDSKILETVTFNPEVSFNAVHVCDQVN